MTRLYCPHALFAGQVSGLTKGQGHYLKNVLRATVGRRITVFNERDGEWYAVISHLLKADCCIKIEGQLSPATLAPDIFLLFAPLKHDALTFLVEKATELGVRSFYPVITERCNISRINHNRLLNNAIDAAQQCERFDIPAIYPLLPLAKTLESWEISIPLFVCQERGEAASAAPAFQALTPRSPAAFLIGPEGGFSVQEMLFLKNLSFTQFINLGPRILRAETAALAALACYQACKGGLAKDMTRKSKVKILYQK